MNRTDLEPKEVLWGYIDSALHHLSNAAGIDDTKLKEYRQRIKALRDQEWHQVLKGVFESWPKQ